MKKLTAILLACTMILSMTGCSGSEVWSAEDFNFKSDAGETVTVNMEQAFVVYEDYSYLNSHVSDEYTENETEYATARGLKLGSTFEDYKKLYAAAKSYVVWEVYDDTTGYTKFVEYTGQSFKEMLEEYDNVWLDLGFKKDGDKWKPMKDVEVQDVWFCDASFDDYEELVIFCVNFDYDGNVIGIALDHVNYDENFATYQAWEE